MAIAAIVVVIFIALWLLFGKEKAPEQPVTIVPPVITEPVQPEPEPEPVAEITEPEPEPEPTEPATQPEP
ncbi:MAG TPA: hypothetical protein VFY01_00755, partial [Rheinheimera sp.]|nr:hypothetical protein [Rheinheimera sp.]